MAATAPPETRLPLFTSDLPLPPPLFRASPYFSPAPNTPSDSGFSWGSTSTSTPMPPRHESSATPKRASKSPVNMTKPKKPSESGGGGLKFITATSNLKEFRKKENMTTVRKQAMDHHLTSEGKEVKRRSKSTARPALSSVPSDASSVVSQEMTVVSSTAPTTASFRATSRASVSSSHNTYALSDQPSPVGRRPSPESILPAAPIVQPSGQGPLPYDRHAVPLFQSIGKALDPFQTMFQSSHPRVSVEELKLDCSRYFGTKSLGQYWIPVALSHPHTFLGTLCLATAYNDVINELRVESLETVALRQEVIHLVSRNMLNPVENVACHNFMGVIQLIISEIIAREEFGLKYHQNGIETMIKHRGGLNQIPELEGRLASSITWVCMASSILHEERSQAIYLEYALAHSRRTYAPTATIPESPIYLPHTRTAFRTLERTKSPCSPKALELMKEVKSMIDVFLQETRQARRNSITLMNIYRRITNTHLFPPLSELKRSGTVTKADFRYEAIRIAAVIQATAIAHRSPLSKVLNTVAGFEERSPTPLYTLSSANQSYDSQISPFDRRSSVNLDPAISPDYSSYNVSPDSQQPVSYFFNASHRTSDTSYTMSHRSSNSSIVTRPSLATSMTSSSLARQSVSSLRSASSENAHVLPATSTSPQADNMLKELRAAINDSNISTCWDDMAGVLFWVGLVVGAATRNHDNRILSKFFSAITMRSGIMLCFEHPEAINATVLRMDEIIEALDDTQSTVPIPKNERDSKRRKA